jgi:hypothetical protein
MRVFLLGFAVFVAFTIAKSSAAGIGSEVVVSVPDQELALIDSAVSKVIINWPLS